ncbi:uncharacterized protein LY89DRAFT_13844 [Mollisia scopiformis]|uniref:Uncharacterized protein n=1 Tax=Mollisia scopiformis TaxID=149040 RepID=A0A194XWR8_MOLSC|nr:uncharacterized protein LY89DRAFT_13844 [Mollisia scopiformis]KUJ24177.1 hypothetical protein LY89DRAFT_13844 [Mollisia scopiformis]
MPFLYFDSIRELPVEIVNISALPRPNRPRFRRRNQHLFDHAYFNLSISQRSLIPSPSPPQNDMPDYFSCGLGERILPTFNGRHDSVFSSQQDESAGEQIGISSNRDAPSCHPDMERINLRAMRVRERLTLRLRHRSSSVQIETSIPEQSSTPFASPLPTIHTPRRAYSFSSSESDITARHIEHVENPIPSYVALRNGDTPIATTTTGRLSLEGDRPVMHLVTPEALAGANNPLPQSQLGADDCLNRLPTLLLTGNSTNGGTSQDSGYALLPKAFSSSTAAGKDLEVSENGSDFK